MKEELLKLLARCRVVEQHLLEERFDIPAKVCESLVEAKLLASETKKDGFRTLTYYTLTSKGEQYVKQEFPDVKEIYRGFILEQDLALVEYYCKLSKEQRSSWITKDDFIKQYQVSGVVDGAYRNDKGEMVGVKVLNAQASFSAVERVEKFLKTASIHRIHYLTFRKEE